jgi:hypothetical protein
MTDSDGRVPVHETHGAKEGAVEPTGGDLEVSRHSPNLTPPHSVLADAEHFPGIEPTLVALRGRSLFGAIAARPLVAARTAAVATRAAAVATRPPP